MLGAEDSLDIDPDEKEASELAKHEAWLEACHANTVKNLHRVEAIANRIGQLSASSITDKAGTAAERFLLERLLLEDEKAHLTRVRAAERDQLQLQQLRDLSGLDQRAATGAPHPAATSVVGPGAAATQQSAHQAASWPNPAPVSKIAEQAIQPTATASGFRSFSITGRAKPPS